MLICPSHPFLSFELDLKALQYEDWLLLGEAASKVGHLIDVPLQPESAARWFRVALIKGVQATTAIEGNTLSFNQVEQIADGHLVLPPSQHYLQQEVTNVLAACNDVLQTLRAGERLDVDAAWIRARNLQLLDHLPLEDGVVPGEWRGHRVGVARYAAPPPEFVPRLMSRLFEWLGDLGERSGRPAVLARPLSLLRAIVAHLYIAWIHPFGDGNGRSARLLELALLLKAGVPASSAHILSNHYNQTRSMYYLELDRASRGSSPYAFIRYSLVGLVDGLREQVRLIQEQQLLVTWTDFVYKTLDPRSPADKRRVQIAIRLAQGPVYNRDAIFRLTPELTLAYGDRNSRSLSRDLAALEASHLLTRGPAGWAANLDIVRAFRPFSADAPSWTGS
jgi:Fic family protein